MAAWFFLHDEKLHQTLQKRCDFSAGGVTAGIQVAFIVALEEADADGPGHGVGGPGGDLAAVAEPAHAALGADVDPQVLRIPIQDRGDLLTGII